MKNIHGMNYPVTDNVQKLMKQQGITVDELSENSGIIIKDLMMILSDQRVIRPDEIAYIAKGLGVDFNALFQEL